MSTMSNKCHLLTTKAENRKRTYKRAKQRKKEN